METGEGLAAQEVECSDAFILRIPKLIGKYKYHFMHLCLNLIIFMFAFMLRCENMKKPRCFPENQCLCSTTFEAAGVSMPGWWGWVRTGDESDTKNQLRGSFRAYIISHNFSCLFYFLHLSSFIQSCCEYNQVNTAFLGMNCGS